MKKKKNQNTGRGLLSLEINWILFQIVKNFPPFPYVLDQNRLKLIFLIEIVRWGPNSDKYSHKKCNQIATIKKCHMMQ